MKLTCRHPLPRLGTRLPLAAAPLAALALLLAAPPTLAQDSGAKTPKEQAEELKATFEAQKAAAEAEKAAAEAKLAVLTAKLGGVPESPVKGDVTLDDKAGALEMALLATVAINQATATIGAELSPLTKGATLYVYPAATPPNLQAVASFLAQRSLVERALTQATDEADKLINPRLEALESLAAVGIAIESITRLLGFFRSDFKVGGVDLTYEDSALLQAAARVVPAQALFVPTLYNAAVIGGAQSLVNDEIASLSTQMQLAGDLDRKLDDAIGAREKAIANTATSKADKATAEQSLPPLRNASTRIKAARTAYDTLLGRILGNDEAAAALLRDLATWKGLKRPGSQLLLLKVQRAGGSYYVEKNLWTSFGAMPFSVSGGAVVSYTLLKADDGAVLASGVQPIHGGFQSVKKVPGSVAATALPAPAARP